MTGPVARLPMRPECYLVLGGERKRRLDGAEVWLKEQRELGTLVPRNPQPLDPAVFARPVLNVPVAVHPAPLVRRRTAREVEIPGAARTVRKLAEANGWMVRATYALGWAIDASGKTRDLTHTLALRMEFGGTMMPDTRMLVAVWKVRETSEALVRERFSVDQQAVAVPPAKGWKFDMAYGWGAGHAIQKLSAAALKESIKEATQ